MPTFIYLHLEILRSNAHSIDQLAESFTESFIEQKCQIKKKKPRPPTFQMLMNAAFMCEYLCVLEKLAFLAISQYNII